MPSTSSFTKKNKMQSKTMKHKIKQRQQRGKGHFSTKPRLLPITRVQDRFTYQTPYDDPTSNGPGTFNIKSMDHVTINKKYRPSAKFGKKHHPSSIYKQDKTDGRKRPYRDILNLPIELDVKYNKLSNTGSLSSSTSSLRKPRNNNNNGSNNNPKSNNIHSSSTPYIKPITMKSRINIMKRKEKRQYNFKKYGYGSWKMESNRFHPSKIFLQAIDPTSPAPGDYNISTTLLHDQENEVANKTISKQHHIITTNEIEHHNYIKQNQPFKSKNPRFISTESLLHGHLNLPHDYIGRVGPGSYNPKHTYNDIIYDNHIVQIERKRPIWLRNNNRDGSNKRLKELMSQTSNFLTPKRNDLLLEFDQPKRWNLNDKRVDVDKYIHPSLILERSKVKVPTAFQSEQFLLDLEHQERMKELEDARRWQKEHNQKVR